ncbi:PhnD/SsuA/transferrin family substrate-binding protein [Massilia dura]|uniref:PhnD/SsuA/transferrin family substrate-binding protein n=1 Tax=Pseudoduganella dura TaxID=321982 RepID=A0A6I3XIL5_9BURK|nr:ABC transporter substrate-binding protein [Pseudoduganella dura]MUI13491.1 PhnD/SsuA/transferrin family substrate-binding protein [Pseudoduganella dura]
MKQARRNIVTRSFRLVAAIALAGAAAQAFAAAPAVIRVGVASPAHGSPPGISGSSIAIAHATGAIEQEFKADNIKVEWFFFKGAGPAVNEALSNKQLDFAFQGDLPSIIGKAAGLKTRLILATGIRANLYLAVPPDSTIRKVEDLRGKRVAFFKGTNGQLPINRLLAAHGLAEKDLRVVNLDTATSQAALTTKDIDAVFGGYDLIKLRDKGVARIVYTSKGDSPVFTRQSHMLVTDDFAGKYPEQTRRFVKAVVKAARWSSDDANREEVFRMWARPGTAKLEHWKEDYEGQPLRTRLSPLFDPFLTERYKDAVEHAYQFRLIRRKFDVDTWIDRSFLNATLKELKLESYWPANPVGAFSAKAAQVSQKPVPGGSIRS